MTTEPQVQAQIKAYLLGEFLEGEDPASLTASTPLVSSGVLDSIATLKLVSFLEQEFTIELAPHGIKLLTLLN